MNETELLNGQAFTSEDGGHQFVITCRRNGEDVALSGTVTGRFMRADGVSVQLTPTYAGITSDGKAWVTLPANCYTVRGQFALVIFHTDGDGHKCCIYSAAGYVRDGVSEQIVDPENVIDVDAIQAMIGDLQEAIEDAQEQATSSVQYTAQSLTDAQKGQARTNIGAGSEADVSDLKIAIGTIDTTLKIKRLTPDDVLNNYALLATGFGKYITNYHLLRYKVVAGEKILINSPTPANTYASFQFQSAKGISELNNDNLVGEPYTNKTTGYIVVPTGATYVIISALNTDTESGLYTYSVFDELRNVSEQVDGIANYTPKQLTSDDFVSGYWNTPGTALESGNTRITANQIYPLSSGDKIVFSTDEMYLGIWAKKASENDYTNVFPYGLTSEQIEIVFDEDSTVIIQMKKSNDGTISPSDYDANITIYHCEAGTLKKSVPIIESDTIEVEQITSADFVNGYYTLITNAFSSSNSRICTKFIRSARKGDIIRYHSPTIQLGVWVLYAGDTAATNIVEYTTTVNAQSFVLPKDATELLFQCKKATGNISPSDMNADISIIRAKAVHGREKDRLARYECIKSVNHRGYQELAPENTLHAFRLSAEHGFEWIETDVQFTSDDVPVILHDRSINRTARNADGTSISSTVNIDDITYAQALDYDFGIWFSDEYAGTKIPTFEQMISYCKNLGLKVRIELKSETVTTSNIPALVDIVKKYGMVRNVEWASFGLSLMQYISTNYPDFNLGYIVSSITSTVVSNALALKTSSNHVTVAASVSNSDANIKLLTDADIPFDVWTITNPGQIINGNKYVSSITTNRYNAQEVLYGMLPS
ncbi:MAG: hypothetical protein IKN00_04240 [Bacteroidales bacterium]|nr:hypothetical protein [Bacteroidales bacterium]